MVAGSTQVFFFFLSVNMFVLLPPAVENSIEINVKAFSSCHSCLSLRLETQCARKTAVCFFVFFFHLTVVLMVVFVSDINA